MTKNTNAGELEKALEWLRSMKRVHEPLAGKVAVYDTIESVLINTDRGQGGEDVINREIDDLCKKFYACGDDYIKPTIVSDIGWKILAARRTDATVSAPDAGHEAWVDISEVKNCLPVLVTRTPDKYIYGPLAAFKDVTGVWRVLGSEGGCCPLPFEPTHFRNMPKPLMKEDI